MGRLERACVLVVVFLISAAYYISILPVQSSAERRPPALLIIGLGDGNLESFQETKRFVLAARFDRSGGPLGIDRLLLEYLPNRILVLILLPVVCPHPPLRSPPLPSSPPFHHAAFSLLVLGL
jgi:hypothetical protein